MVDVNVYSRWFCTDSRLLLGGSKVVLGFYCMALMGFKVALKWFCVGSKWLLEGSRFGRAHFLSSWFCAVSMLLLGRPRGFL